MARRKKKLTAVARRAQLIEVGRSVFAERGFVGTSVEEIAARAKVSKPIIYEHFGGKEGLYAVIVDREIEYMVARISEALMSGTPRERVEASALAFLNYVNDHPDGFSVLAHDAPVATGGGNMSSLLSEVADRVTDVVAEAFQAAGYNLKSAPVYAHGLVGLVSFVGQWWMEERKPPLEEVAGHITALAWMGLRHLPKEPDALPRRPPVDD